MNHFKKKTQIIRSFLLFLVPYVFFLFESLKLIIQFPPRFDQIAGCSELLKYFNIFQKFLSSSKCFLFHVNVSYFFYLAPKEFFFLEQNQFLQLLELLKILHQTLILILSAALLYRCGGVRNYFSYKVTVYLPTENIKPFVENG